MKTLKWCSSQIWCCDFPFSQIIQSQSQTWHMEHKAKKKIHIQTSHFYPLGDQVLTPASSGLWHHCGPLLPSLMKWHSSLLVCGSPCLEAASHHLLLCCHGAFSLWLSVPTFPSSYRDTSPSVWIRIYSKPVWPHPNMITSAKVTFAPHSQVLGAHEFGANAIQPS